VRGLPPFYAATETHLESPGERLVLYAPKRLWPGEILFVCHAIPPAAQREEGREGLALAWKPRVAEEAERLPLTPLRQ